MSTQFHMHKARLETLVDGVFAIAMTILVLEVKVPEIADGRSTDALLHALAHHGYVIGAYFFSFAMLALFWPHVPLLFLSLPFSHWCSRPRPSSVRSSVPAHAYRVPS